MNRARVAARADWSPRINHKSTVLHVAPVSNGSYQGRSRRGVKLTATQRNSQGRHSEWNRSPYAPKGGWR